MEHLSPESRQKVIKMSEARLRQKLVQAVYREVDVAKFDRATLLEYYAKVLLTETAYVPAKEEQEEGEEAGSDGVEEITYENMWNEMLERYLYGPLRRQIKQCRQSEFVEWSGDRSLFVPVPKPRTGIKSGIGEKETQPENVVIDRYRFVPVPKPRTSIQPGNCRA